MVGTARCRMLHNILLLFACIPPIKYSLSAPPNKRNAKSTITFKAHFRKQYGPQMMPPPSAQGSSKKGIMESYYEPYWEKGDWVYYRGESTSKPHPFYLNVGNTTEHDECNQICTDIILNYGNVCAIKYNEISAKYDFKTFDDYCYMELENCYDDSRRYKWFLLNRGNCTTGLTTQSYAHMLLVTRASLFEAEILGIT